MDVWFDSDLVGPQFEQRSELKYPADLYLEGSDQHRGCPSVIFTNICCS